MARPLDRPRNEGDTHALRPHDSRRRVPLRHPLEGTRRGHHASLRQVHEGPLRDRARGRLRRARADAHGDPGAHSRWQASGPRRPVCRNARTARRVLCDRREVRRGGPRMGGQNPGRRGRHHRGTRSAANARGGHGGSREAEPRSRRPKAIPPSHLRTRNTLGKDEPSRDGRRLRALPGVFQRPQGKWPVHRRRATRYGQEGEMREHRGRQACLA